jgi:hypothetical protein
MEILSMLIDLHMQYPYFQKQPSNSQAGMIYTDKAGMLATPPMD